jgi:hypothetical protein
MREIHFKKKTIKRTSLMMRTPLNNTNTKIHKYYNCDKTSYYDLIYFMEDKSLCL